MLLLGLLLGDALDGVLPESDWLSITAIATWMVAFGFGAVLLQRGAGLTAGQAAIGGAAAGFAFGYVALRWSRSLSKMATDGTPTAADLTGCEGRVITAIPPNSTGEVLVRLGGQPVKLTAVAGQDQRSTYERGVDIVVVNVLSATRVEVQAAETFWGTSEQTSQ